MNFIIIILLALGAVFFACMIGAVFGAMAGFVVGLLFDESMALLARALGIPDAAPYQLGAIFGFLGGFFRSSLEVKK